MTKHTHVHMLRHTWASHCIKKGIPSRVVMLWGGWENEEILKRHARFAPREVETLIHHIAPSRAPLTLVQAPQTHGPRHFDGINDEGNSKTAR